MFRLMCPYSYPEIDQLAEHGIMKPPEMQGLSDEQIDELKLKDDWAAKCYPSGEVHNQPDPIGRRGGNGRIPSEICKRNKRKEQRDR